MRHKFILLVLSISLLFISTCTRKEGFVDIVLPESQRLEDTIPGWFIKAMNLGYSTQKDTKRLMHDHLNKFGTLIDKFKDENDDLHIIWEYYDVAGIIDKYRKDFGSPNPILWYYGWTDNRIIIEEKLDESGFSYIYRYPPPGIPWNEVLASDCKNLTPNRKNTVVIKSKADEQTRIFLFGQGNFCTRIVVL